MRSRDRYLISLIYILIIVVIISTIPVFKYGLGQPHPTVPENARFITTISRVWENNSDIILDIRVAQPVNYESKNMPCDLVEIEIDYERYLIRLVWWEIDWTQPDEHYIIILNHTTPYPDLEFPMDWWDWIDQAPKNAFIIQYNAGEITGIPKASARANLFMPIEYTPVVANRELVEAWGAWSTPINVEVTQSLPLVEIATVIGIGGIAIAVINNYLSGRREKQMTEVTRTAAVDERFMELYDASRETTFQENMAEVLYQYEWTDYDNFLEKYGPRTNVAAWAKIQSLAQYFEGIGVMLQSNSVEIDQVYRLLSTQIIRCWKKFQPVILEQRQRELDPRIYSSFETLYYAIKKYEQAPSKPSDDVKTHRFED